MTKDYIKWLALNGLKKSIEDWTELRKKYIEYLGRETSEVAKDNWLHLIKEADDFIDRNRKLLQEVEEYEL